MYLVLIYYLYSQVFTSSVTCTTSCGSWCRTAASCTGSWGSTDRRWGNWKVTKYHHAWCAAWLRTCTIWWTHLKQSPRQWDQIWQGAAGRPVRHLLQQPGHAAHARAVRHQLRGGAGHLLLHDIRQGRHGSDEMSRWISLYFCRSSEKVWSLT